jgi:hypothetical protein
MNRHVATLLLIIAAGALTSCKSHSHQADNQFTDVQASRAEAADIARSSPRPSTYASNQSDHVDEDSQAVPGPDTDGPDFDGPDSDGPDMPSSARASSGTLSPARLDLASWTPQTAGDSSATVLLPPNWRLTAVAEGAASVAGPNKEEVVLGFQTFVTPGSGNYAPYMGPEQALNWVTRMQGIQLLRVLDHAPASEMNPSGEAEFMTVITQHQDGSTYKGLALVMTNQMQMGTWRLHVSCIAAPVEQFDAAASTMKAIWSSWKLDGGYLSSSQNRAAATRAQTSSMVMQDARRSGHALDNQIIDFDNTMNDVNIMRNTDTGQRYETQIGTEGQFVRDCERRDMSCRQVPTNELGGPQ